MKQIVKKSKCIESLYKNYEEEILTQPHRQKPHRDEKALIFFIHIIFNQGRRDLLSERFIQEAMRFINDIELIEIPEIPNIDVKYGKQELNKIYGYHLERLYNNYELNKEADRYMLLYAIGYANNIRNNKNKNIIKYNADLIRKGKLQKAYNQLDNIYSVGDKITSLVLRDIVFVYNYMDYISESEFHLLQPIDTWVVQVARELKIVDETLTNKITIAKTITTFCLNNGIDPLKFNAGAWYLGARSFKILLNNINFICR